jgi:hypothetical protein
MRSSKGKKIYAVRDKKGKFKDIQSYKRAMGADIKRKAGRKRRKRRKSNANGPQRSAPPSIPAGPNAFSDPDQHHAADDERGGGPAPAAGFFMQHKDRDQHGEQHAGFA